MRLIDCFMPVAAYIVDLRSALPRCEAPYPQVKEEIRQLLAQAESAWQESGGDRELLDRARFMICAWIDETLLASQWPDRGLWQHEQLQRLFYRTTDAGVESFQRLEELGDQQEVREVYCLCLALGFRGRYLGEEGEFHLEQLRSAHLKRLFEESGELPVLKGLTLFPAALSAAGPAVPVRRAPSFSFSPLAVMVMTVPLMLFALLYLVYRYLLNGLVLPNL